MTNFAKIKGVQEILREIDIKELDKQKECPGLQQDWKI